MKPDFISFRLKSALTTFLTIRWKHIVKQIWGRLPLQTMKRNSGCISSRNWESIRWNIICIWPIRWMVRGLKFCGSYIRERRKTNPIDNISFCGWQMVVKTASEAVKQGIWCLSHQMPCLSKILILCGFVPYFSASDTATAQATVAPTIGLLPIPIKPIISTWAGTEEEPANCASPCIRPMESVKP